jgi:hypothetical protein
MTFKILPILGHVELHINGKFYCTADNHREATQEYNKYVEERLKDENQSAEKELQYS